MLCIRNNITDAYFNLAAEEYILRNFKENCFMLWRNKPSIIVGKHQNALAEINTEYVKEHNINVVRRLSGGGTVFHDLGNLNFTFIQNIQGKQDLVDFKRYTKPIVEVLNRLGVRAKFEGRNDIMIDGKKISGNAEHVFKNRVLHHGTLLFSSNITDLSKALKVNPLRYQDRGVKSVRSRVTNICEYLSKKISITEFQDTILSYIMNTDNSSTIYEFTENDKQQIDKLVKEKYSTWNWNFGYSPKYNFEKSVKTNNGNLEIQMFVEKGFITKMDIVADSVDNKSISQLTQLFIGVEHDENSVRETLSKISSNQYFQHVTADELMSAMF